MPPNWINCLYCGQVTNLDMVDHGECPACGAPFDYERIKRVIYDAGYGLQTMMCTTSFESEVSYDSY